MTSLSLSELQQDLQGLLLSTSQNLPSVFTGFSIDTRTIQPGEVFIALQGDHLDGHAYVSQAFEKGAAAAVVSKTIEGSYPLLTVRNVDETLVALGQGGRRHAEGAKIIGVTGSVGKTGTKEALLHVLSTQGSTHANVASFNNQWGTPLSLARMPQNTAFGIFEMGMNSPGEIAALTRQIRPHVALITVIGDAHKGFFPSLEAIADAKAEIFQGVEPGGTAVLNHDDPLFEHLKQHALAANIPSVISFGAHPKADIRLLDATLEADSSKLKISYGGTILEGRLAHPGRHWVSNALGVMGVLFALNLPPEKLFDRLSTLPPLPGRGRRVSLQLPGRTLTLLDESYNANPTSVTAALELLAQQNPKARRVAVLGDMLELGQGEIQDHQNLKDTIQQLGIDLVFTCGPLMQSLDAALPSSQRGGWAPTVDALFPFLNEKLEDGDILMIKGSKRMQLGRVLENFLFPCTSQLKPLMKKPPASPETRPLFLRGATPSTPLSLKPLELLSDFKPAGDQPQAIQELIESLREGAKNQVLLGVTGSGKTFTVAHVINTLQRPALVLAPNKTLAAQLYQEMQSFFPHNAVEYFVSYYDYYQPEAYVARTDTYIEKEATINEQIDRMRHSATQALLERRDVIVVASVSCIYGIGSVESYSRMVLDLAAGQRIARKTILDSLTALQYKRGDGYLSRGTFRAKGDILEISPAHYEDRAWRLSLFGDEIETIVEVDPLTGQKIKSLVHIKIYPNSHYVTPGPTVQQAIGQIKKDLQIRLQEFEADGRLLEAQRLRERTTFDLEMLTTTGMCAGIENYSRYLTGRAPGEPPPTLFEYLPQDTLLIVDESHVSVPQIQGMSRGDAVRKRTLSEHGFRLPSCADNRPLRFEEWDFMRPQTIFVSATPGPWELEQTQGVFVEQLIRPTGLMDPVCDIRPTEGQVDDLIAACRDVISRGFRVLVTTLTKKMAEALQEYFEEIGIKSRYIHADVETLERIEIIQGLRRGTFDVLIGINLLREGLDIPECALVAIMDADREGYLRSATSLIQTMGRAARHVEGRVILYADKITNSMAKALEETTRRREKQEEYNRLHGITPETIRKNLPNILASVYEKDHVTVPLDDPLPVFKKPHDRQKYIAKLEKEMHLAAQNLAFEEAIRLRNRLKLLTKHVID